MHLLSTSKSHVRSCKLLFLASRAVFLFIARNKVAYCTFKWNNNLTTKVKIMMVRYITGIESIGCIYATFIVFYLCLMLASKFVS